MIPEWLEEALISPRAGEATLRKRLWRRKTESQMRPVVLPYELQKRGDLQKRKKIWVKSESGKINNFSTSSSFTLFSPFSSHEIMDSDWRLFFFLWNQNKRFFVPYFSSFPSLDTHRAASSAPHHDNQSLLLHCLSLIDYLFQTWNEAWREVPGMLMATRPPPWTPAQVSSSSSEGWAPWVSAANESKSISSLGQSTRPSRDTLRVGTSPPSTQYPAWTPHYCKSADTSRLCSIVAFPRLRRADHLLQWWEGVEVEHPWRLLLTAWVAEFLTSNLLT